MNKAEREIRKRQIVQMYCIDDLTINVIAKRLGVSRQAIYEQLQSAGIDTKALRKRRQRRLLEYDELYTLYTVKKLAAYKIARILRTTPKVVDRELDRYRMERRPVQWRARPPSEIDGLGLGESCVIARSPSRVAYCNVYLKAAVRGMKVSIRRVDAKSFRVTRTS